MMLVTRSKPMPVSTCLAGSGENVPSGFALNWMKTRFQISMQRASPLLTSAPLRVAGGREVHVDFGARTARAGVAHHPEIVLLAADDDVDLRDPGRRRRKFSAQMVPGFLVELGRIARDRVYRRWRRAVPAEISKPFCRHQFPRPVDGFLFEIIAEAPVAEHLEKRVVIGVQADVFQVVVLAAGADALLGVGGAAGLVGAFGLAEENGHELVHAGVGEQQVRRSGSRLEDGTMVCCFDLKKSRNDWRICVLVIMVKSNCSGAL